MGDYTLKELLIMEQDDLAKHIEEAEQELKRADLSQEDIFCHTENIHNWKDRIDKIKVLLIEKEEKQDKIVMDCSEITKGIFLCDNNCKECAVYKNAMATRKINERKKIKDDTKK